MTSSPPETSAVLNALRWIEGVLLGPLATSLAVLAVAAVGLMMLSGRLNLRRGATVILGCFIVFGAATIARGLREGVATTTAAAPAPPAAGASFVPAPPTPEPAPAPEDPYAGAAVRR